MNFEVEKKGEFYFRKGTLDEEIWHCAVEANEYRLGDITGEVVIDIGCNAGAFMHAALLHGADYVIGVDPDADSIGLAKLNLKQWGPRVKLLNRAVWRSDINNGSLLPLSDYTVAFERCINTGSRSTVRKGKGSVLSLGLDTLIQEVKKDYGKVSRLKLDCEGSEYPILLSSKLLFEFNSICGEYHELDALPEVADQISASARIDDRPLLLKTLCRELQKQGFRKFQVARVDDPKTNKPMHQGFFWFDKI